MGQYSEQGRFGGIYESSCALIWQSSEMRPLAGSMIRFSAPDLWREPMHRCLMIQNRLRPVVMMPLRRVVRPRREGHHSPMRRTQWLSHSHLILEASCTCPEPHSHNMRYT